MIIDPEGEFPCTVRFGELADLELVVGCVELQTVHERVQDVRAEGCGVHVLVLAPQLSVRLIHVFSRYGDRGRERGLGDGAS